MAETDTPVPHVRSRLDGVDAARFLGFIAVVLLHTAAGGTYAAPDAGKFLDLLCRFAVPFFFLASGYFIGTKPNISLPALRSARRIAMLFAIWICVYILADQSDLPHALSLNYVKWVVLTGGPGYHLWFLSALACCLVLASAENALFGGRFMIVVGLLLYITGLCLDEVKNLLWPGLRGFDVRIGPFFGLLFVAMGMQIARKHIRLPISACLVLIATGLVLEVTEASVLYEWHARGFADNINYYVGTVPFALGVFMLSLNIKRTPSWLSRLGQITLGLYSIHVALIWLIDRYVPHVTFPQKLAVATATVVLSAVLISVLMRVRSLRPLLR